ncbi:MAG: PhnD/SsuA/transferrin family substrate-binding protein [Deltaproteobacteria bacterium]|nr:PhnD/SsuA/transferrin family substrate-binding protein [Deltaproteobacteria bacterium]
MKAIRMKPALDLSRLLLFLFLFLQLPAETAQATGAADRAAVKIGILSFQPKPETLQRWQPMADYLNRALAPDRFAILPLKEDELERSISRNELDFVLTNPSHYIYLSHIYKLSAPLLTVIRGVGDKFLHSFGGTIFTLASRDDIHDLGNLKNCRIALPFRLAFGACQMQEYELLLADKRPLRDEQFVFKALPHTNIVQAVREHEADVGFARAGILENMAAQGVIKLAEFKIINPQTPADFPYRLSTRLYPEWPLAALEHISRPEQGRLLATLLLMPDRINQTLPFGIRGFAPPASYQEVENVLRELRAAPFDVPPEFRWQDLWHLYHWSILGIGAVFFGIILLLIRLSWVKKSLETTGTALKEKSVALEKLTTELESRVLEETAKRRKQEAVLVQQAKLAAMGEMIGAIAHQWRQPLNALGLCLQNLLDASAYNELTAEYLEKTSRKAMGQINMMSRTIDDFRNFFRIEKRKVSFDTMEVSGRVLALLSPQLENQNIDWRLTCKTHQRSFTSIEKIALCAEKKVTGYGNEFEHVILNLISNAKEAILAKRMLKQAQDSAPEKGHIEIIFSRENEWLLIEVKDNGIGIDRNLRERIFEPYFTTCKTHQGTGLGLYISKVIIEEHMHGTLTLKMPEEEPEDGGACFTIKLPYQENITDD